MTPLRSLVFGVRMRNSARVLVFELYHPPQLCRETVLIWFCFATCRSYSWATLWDIIFKLCSEMFSFWRATCVSWRHSNFYSIKKYPDCPSKHNEGDLVFTASPLSSFFFNHFFDFLFLPGVLTIKCTNTLPHCSITFLSLPQDRPRQVDTTTSATMTDTSSELPLHK